MSEIREFGKSYHPTNSIGATDRSLAAVGATGSGATDVDVLYGKMQRAAEYIKERAKLTDGTEVEFGIICGSGLKVISEVLEDPVHIPFHDIPDFPSSDVEGHSNVVVLGRIGNTLGICFQGRIHYYEGNPMWKVTMPIRIMRLLGVRVVFVTNAAGGVDKKYNVGDIMVIKDHVNLSGTNPLIGPNDPRWGPRFPDLRNGYDRRLRSMCNRAFHQLNLSKIYREGVYCMVSGPSYETNAEIHMMRVIGVGTIGMSTVPEVIVANHSQMKVCAMSVIATTLEDEEPVTEGQNGLLPDPSPNPLDSISHEAVLRVAEEAGKNISKVIELMVSWLAT